MPQLVTITLNPAVDVSTTVDVVRPEHKLRCGDARSEAGGGGINVARVAARLGIEVEALLLAGGATGHQLLDLLAAEGLTATAVSIDADTRQSFTVDEATTGSQYRFVLPGPAITGGDVDRVGEAVAATGPIGCLVISGSVPPGAPPGVLGALIQRATGGDASSAAPPVIVDTSGPELARVLGEGPTVVKPSARELSALVGRELATEDDVLDAATEVVASSTVEAVLASIGAGGAILARRSGPPVRLRPPAVKVVSAVGAGDSMVAGVATGLCRGLDLVDAAALGVAAGTAAVMTPGSELCRPDQVDAVLPSVRVEERPSGPGTRS